jgi:hypothetical protein
MPLWSAPALFKCYLCKKECSTSNSLASHISTAHNNIDPALKTKQLFRVQHPKLNGKFLFNSKRRGLINSGVPCNADGTPLATSNGALPSLPPVPLSSNPFWPFENRHEFDWVVHYVQDLSASKRQISKGLDLWLSSTLHPGYTGPPVPWKNAREMYNTVDAIQQGTVPWKRYEIKYQGPVDENSPKWKLQTYELCYRDVLQLMEEQLANPDFKDDCDYVPFMELDEAGEPIYSEFFSGEWSWTQCVCFSYYDCFIHL